MNKAYVGIGIALSILATLTALTGDRTTLVPGPQAIPASFFGMNINHMVSPNGTHPLTPWPSEKVPEWRLWDARVTWPDIEPTKGGWRFDTLDKSVQMAQDHDAGVVLTLGLSPRWVSARPQEPSAYQPGFAAEPKDLQEWRTFVATVATRFKGRIQGYEIWNEPNMKEFWSGNTDQMLALVRETSQIVRAIDPQAMIVSPAPTGASGVTWLSEFLRKGGGQYVDIIGYHFYVGDQRPEAMVALIQRVREIMAENGVSAKPLWDTEAGWLKPNPFPSDELGGAYLARAYILNWAAGVQRFYWYAWDNHLMMIETTQADNYTVTPAGRAFGIVQKWLTGASIEWCNGERDHTWTCELRREGELSWIVWNPDGEKTIAVPSSWHPKSITPLLKETQPWNRSNLNIGPYPVLVTN